MHQDQLSRKLPDQIMNSHLTIIMQDVARVDKRYAGQHLSRPISCGEFGLAPDFIICLNNINFISLLRLLVLL